MLKRLCAWVIVTAFASIPLSVAFSFVYHDFSREWKLWGIGAVVCGGLYAAIQSASRLYGESYRPMFQRALKWSAFSFAALAFVACLQHIVLELWAGGFSTDFSSGFDLTASNLGQVSHKPHAWLVYVLYLGLGCACWMAILSGWHFLRALSPFVDRVHFVLVTPPRRRRRPSLRSEDRPLG